MSINLVYVSNRKCTTKESLVKIGFLGADIFPVCDDDDIIAEVAEVCGLENRFSVFLRAAGERSLSARCSDFERLARSAQLREKLAALRILRAHDRDVGASVDDGTETSLTIALSELGDGLHRKEEGDSLAPKRGESRAESIVIERQLRELVEKEEDRKEVFAGRRVGAAHGEEFRFLYG